MLLLNMDDLPLFSPAKWKAVGRALDLTQRQLQVAQLVCAECSVVQMARRMNRSRDTVSTHLKSLYRRLGVRTRVGVVVRLLEAERRLREPPK